MSLTFEFKALYDDGTLILQKADTPEEVAFKDLDKSKLSCFQIVGKEKFIKVDPRTGEFNINGLPVRFGWLPQKPGDVIYFRRVRVDVVGDMAMTSTQYAIGLSIENAGETFQAICLVDDYGRVLVTNKK